MRCVAGCCPTADHPFRYGPLGLCADCHDHPGVHPGRRAVAREPQGEVWTAMHERVAREFREGVRE